jgi:hypothetical protein
MQHAVLPVVLIAGIALLLGASRVLCAAEPGKVVFSWVPGDPQARTAAGTVVVRGGQGTRRVDCAGGRALQPGPDGLLGAADVKLGQIPERGTVRFWIKLDRRIQVAGSGEEVTVNLLECEDLRLQLRERDNGVLLHARGAKLVRRPRAWGAASFDLTHLRGGQWYHMAVRYDAPKGKWRLILNGVLQPEPWPHGPFRFQNVTRRIALRGLMTPKTGKAKPARVTLGPISWHAGLADPKDVLAELRAIRDWKIPPNRGEGVLETIEAFDGEALGGEVLYENRFDKPLEKDLWVVEGPGRVEVKDGRLLKHNADRSGGRDLVLWLRKRLPRDFVAAWDIQPTQLTGLTLVHFASMGTRGRDLFDPSLAKRNGAFGPYIRGDIRCYHCSYHAGTRGSANMRKNPGFFIVGMGPELVGSQMVAGRKGPFRFVLVRRGNRIEAAVDGKRFLQFVDDGVAYGPVFGGGYLGLRQQFNSGTIAYDNLVIRALKEPVPND